MTQATVSATAPASPVEWLRTGEACRELGVSETRVRKLGDEGILTMQRTPLGRLYARASVLQYKQSRRRAGRPAKRQSEIG